MSEIKSTKRSGVLELLSAEHRDGLLFIWKLRQGLTNHTSNEKLREYVSWYWQNHIKAHFFQEEKILTPCLDSSHPLVVKLNDDHCNIRDMVLTIDREPDRYSFVWLCNLIESHIHFEERELYPFIESQLTWQQLESIEMQLKKYPVICKKEWNDNFWSISHGKR